MPRASTRKRRKVSGIPVVFNKKLLKMTLNDLQWTYAEMAEECNVCLATIGHLMTGHTQMPRMSTLVAVAEVCDQPLEAFFYKRSNHK